MRFQTDMFCEIIVDSFAGGGGASTGIELATGRVVDAAINHDPDAILMHKTNHPYTTHYQASVWDVDPVEVCRGRPVGLLWASPDCFPAGTLILTQKGYIPIEQIVVGDMVLTHKMRWRPVTATMTSQRDELVVKGYGHPGLTCSPGHPFYVCERTDVWDEQKNKYEHIYSAPKWKKAKDLTQNDYWGCPAFSEEISIPEMKKSNDATITLPIDERLMWLAGRYTGDGWTRLTDTRGEVVIVCGKSEIDYLREKLNMWPRSGKRAKNGELAWNFRYVRTGGQFTCNSRSLVTWLRENFGHLAGEKQIPAWLLGASEEMKKAFLDGYVGADGHENGNLIEVSTVSKKLAYGLKTLVATIGFSPCVYLQNWNSNTIEGRSVNARPVFKIKWRVNIDEKHRQTFLKDGIMWSAIKSSEATGKQAEFFNISVEEDESYVAEGVIVHNCKHFSKAKGGKPVEKRIRGLAWIVLRWAGTVRPRVIILENVEEFQTWGPVRRGRPVKSKSGETFRKFIEQLGDLGYAIEWRELVAADYGAPTTRKRFFLIARCDGRPIVWPEPTHAPADSPAVKSGLKKPWRSAAEIIDWNLPCPSIFETREQIREKYGLFSQRPLRPNTMRRVIRGVDKFVLKEPNPFLVVVNHAGDFRGQNTTEPLQTVTAKHGYGVVNPVMAPLTAPNTTKSVGSSVSAPLHTVTTAGNQMLITPTLSAIGQTGGGNRVRSVTEPTHTQVSKAEECLVAPELIQYHTEQTERVRGQGVADPLMTIDAANRYGLTAASLLKYYGNDQHGQNIREPLHTVTAKDREGLTMAHMAKFYGTEFGESMGRPLSTVTASGAHHGVVETTVVRAEPGANLKHWPEIRNLLNTYCGYHLGPEDVILFEIDGAAYFMADIGLRMLTPRELYRANGFPDDYKIERDYKGNVYGKSKQVARCGNAVPPPFATALVRANFPEWCKNTITTMAEFEKAVAV